MSGSRVEGGEPERQEAVRNRGASYRVGGENLGILAPMRTLDDDYRDEPAEPVDSERIPEPEPRGRIRRLFDRLTGPPNP